MPERQVSALVVQDTLQAVVDRLHCLVDECVFAFDEDGLTVTAKDPANVALVDLALNADAFESYSVGQPLRVGIDLGRLDDVIGLADSGALLQLTVAETQLHVAGDEMAYEMATIDPDSVRDAPDIPELDLTAYPSLTGAQLDRAASGADLVSDHVTIRFDAATTTAVVEATGDTDTVAFEYGEADMPTDLPASEDAEAIYSLDYITAISSVLADDEAVLLKLGPTQPVVLSQPFGEGRGEVTYQVAPRLEVDS